MAISKNQKANFSFFLEEEEEEFKYENEKSSKDQNLDDFILVAKSDSQKSRNSHCLMACQLLVLNQRTSPEPPPPDLI